jgi:hypothetical protein
VLLTSQIAFSSSTSIPRVVFRSGGFNPTTEKAVGFKNSEIMGRLVEEAAPPQVARCITSNCQKCIEAGVPLSYEEALDLSVGRKYVQYLKSKSVV